MQTPIQPAARPLRLAVVGHVEHVTIGRVPAIPLAGEIVHLEQPFWLAGGGGGVALHQLSRAPGEVHFFTVLGADDAARQVEADLARTGAQIHAARRDAPHGRVVAMIAPDGERTILVMGEPLHPMADDPLPWDLLATLDAVYFTSLDPRVLRAARAARVLVVSARRQAVLAAAGVCADAVVGSAADPREACALADYPAPPAALVLTEGAAGGRIETPGGTARFQASPAPLPGGGAYGAGDSFAGALTFYLAAGLPLIEASARAAPHGAAVLRGLDPRETQLPLVLPDGRDDAHGRPPPAR